MVRFENDKLVIEILGAGDPFDTYVQLTNALFSALAIVADEGNNSDLAKQTISTLSYYLGTALTELSREDKAIIEKALRQARQSN